MQMFAYSHTERGIRLRRMQRLEAQRAEEARIEAEKREAERLAAPPENAELAAVKQKLSELEAQIAHMNEPVVIEFPRTEYRKIEEIALRVFKVSRSELRSKRRHSTLVLARQFVMYWAARRTLLSYPQIGKMLGGRDHTSIIHGKGAYVEKRASMGRTLRKAR